MQAGVNASGEQVLEWLVKADTASAFNISFGDVSVTGVQQVCPQSLSSTGLAIKAQGRRMKTQAPVCSAFGAPRPSSLKPPLNSTACNHFLIHTSCHLQVCYVPSLQYMIHCLCSLVLVSWQLQK